MSYTDNETQNLIVNKLTKEQYKTITDSNTNNEVYHITDDAHYTEAEIKELLSAKQDNLTAGDGINIENGVISNTRISAEWGNIQGDITQQTDLQNILNDNKLEINTKQNTLVDTQTIDVDGSSLTAIGVQSKSGDILYDWIGTEAEYNAGILDGTINLDWLCYITDDESELINSIPIATITQTGLVRPDGTTITINNGIISAVGDESEEYVLPTASTTILGGVKVDGSTININNGVISAEKYVLPVATTSVLGGVKVDNSTIKISNQTISVNGVNTVDNTLLKFKKLTQSEYDTLATKDENTLYIITG